MRVQPLVVSAAVTPFLIAIIFQKLGYNRHIHVVFFSIKVNSFCSGKGWCVDWGEMSEPIWGVVVRLFFLRSSLAVWSASAFFFHFIPLLCRHSSWLAVQVPWAHTCAICNHLVSRWIICWNSTGSSCKTKWSPHWWTHNCVVPYSITLQKWC